MAPTPLVLRPVILLPACALLAAVFHFRLLPASIAFLIWSLLLGAIFGYHSARLRRWMARFPTPGYFGGRRQARATAIMLWLFAVLLLLSFPPLQPLDLRTWCFSLLGSPTVALLHAAGMAGTMALAYLLLPPPRPDEPHRQAIVRMRWAITIMSFTIFYVGLSIILAVRAPRVLPLMITLFLTPVAFCLAHDRQLSPKL